VISEHLDLYIFTGKETKMLIRKMTIDDYDSVYDLWLNTPGIGLNDLDDSRKGIEKYLRRNPETCFVAEKDNKIIGAILCGNDGRRGYIHHTTVAEAERKNGVGTALVEAAINALEREGINKVALVVFQIMNWETLFGKSEVSKHVRTWFTGIRP